MQEIAAPGIYRQLDPGDTLGIILTVVQRDATQSSLFIILQVHSTCFGCQTLPSSRVHITVTTASGTGHIFRAATSIQRDHKRRMINRLLCVASRWTIININQRYMEP